jgi:Flp pilus assembly pilin Flp
MLKAYAFLQNLPIRRDDRGMTAVEYGLLLALVGAALIIGLGIFGPALGKVFGNFASNF